MPKSSFTNELLRLHELLEKGAISKEEYEEQKSRLFNQARSSDLAKDIPKDGNASSESSDLTNKAPQIIISQNTSASATSTAIAKAKNGGCLKTILAAIGFFVVLGTILATCSVNDDKKDFVENNSDSDIAPVLDNSAENQNSDSVELQEKLEEAKRANVIANNTINAFWDSMDSDVRDFLTSDEMKWNKSKIVQCKTSDYGTPEENQIAYISCLTNLTNERTVLLRKQQEELLPKIKEEKLQKVKLDTQNSTDLLKETWESLQEPIKGQLRPDFDKWAHDVDKQCESTATADIQIQTDINHYVCMTKLIKIKTKELNGYRI